ncbi:uncharacterized protein LOC134534667 [Bacillus rossius redtenbacheri]|uniref:uncharacterized protein LOC134534667 n=1 Tax=Bacillus rossius redtenbacheri TaxID=93214 RepID=UPI002FDEE0A8
MKMRLLGLDLFLIAALSLLEGARCLKMGRLSVPPYKIRGEGAELVCDYELEDDALYSVKWYKDDEEFFRFVPKSDPPKSSYKIEGVKVDHTLSDDKRVALRSLTLQSSGTYRCEVSAEAPSFASAQKEAHMEVVYLPKDGPHITGEKRQYHRGDEISLNCTSGKSYPASVLHWYINDHQVRDRDELVQYPELVHHYGLVTSALGLRFKVEDHQFQGGSIRVRCVASVFPGFWVRDKERVVERVDQLKDHVREALLLVRAASSCHGASLFVVSAMLSLAVSAGT